MLNSCNTFNIQQHPCGDILSSTPNGTSFSNNHRVILSVTLKQHSLRHSKQHSLQQSSDNFSITLGSGTLGSDTFGSNTLNRSPAMTTERHSPSNTLLATPQPVIKSK